MDNPTPAPNKSYKAAPNVTAGGVVVALTIMLLQTLQANAINIPEQVMDDLPGLLGFVVPYLWDLWTGDNVK
jgi:hypothetical protein